MEEKKNNKLVKVIILIVIIIVCIGIGIGILGSAMSMRRYLKV